MSLADPPSMKPGDDLEALLRAFFRSQMPPSWPAPPLPDRAVVSSPRTLTGHGLNRSRWALAASVALLLLGSLLLPARFPQEAPSEKSLGNMPAIGSNDLPRRFKREQERRHQHDRNKHGASTQEDDQLPEMDDSNLPSLK